MGVRRGPIAAGVAILLLGSLFGAGVHGESTVAINGTANYLDTTKGGPPGDFTDATGAQFQAANPSVTAFNRLVAANPAYAASNKGLTNVVASRTPVTMVDPMTGQNVTVRDYSESNLVVNPANGALVGASKFFSQPDSYYFKLGSFASNDGGKSYTSQELPGYAQFTNVTDPTLAFDDIGNVYSLNLPFSLAYNPAGNTVQPGGPDNSAITVNKSPDGGKTWGAPVYIKSYNASGLGYTPDKQWLTADTLAHSPGKGNLYAFWTEYTGGASRIVVSRSSDRGSTWTEPLAVTAPKDQPFAQYAQPGVGPDGTLYVTYGVFPYAKNVSNSSLWVQSSRDFGATWSAPMHVADTAAVPYQLPNTTFRDGILESAVVSPVNGTIAVAYEDYSNGDVDILVTRSTDGGHTWSAPVRVNDNPVQDGTDQFQPNLAVAPNGTFALAFYDRRLPCAQGDANISAGFQGKYNTCLDTTLTVSTDDGATWTTNRRVTQNGWDPSLNAPRPYHGSTTFIGDYFGVAMDNNTAWVLHVSTYNVGGMNPGNYQKQVSTAVPLPHR
jgi:hypothetical protein